MEAFGKVQASHLKRDAYLYVRQSTLRQVLENTESTKRQYALRQRAVALGWPLEQVVVIDSDQGQSGASAVDREGFQRLVADVGLGRVGIVLGLEVSRLARSSSDWYRLLEICALTDTLILDEDGIYDPGHFNDRLLLGLKGTMSEAELHVLRARLRGGVLSKARRGELKSPLPVGLVYGPDDRVILDPDRQVQQAVRLFFQTFRRTGSALATVRVFGKQGLLFPGRVRTGPNKGDLVWGELAHSRTLHVLKNPRYAGAFFFGRRQCRRTVDGRSREELLPQDQWIALFPETHPGYITWAEYEENQRRLRENAQALGADRRKSPPREGPALLQGLAICGLCGQRMTVRYRSCHGRILPHYLCQRQGIQHGQPLCQSIPGRTLDKAIGELLVEAVTPIAIEVTLAVQEELNARAQEVDRLRRQQVERARYEADLAQRRYMRVDPDNRLVADSLEADWNQKLRALAEAQAEYERQCQADRRLLDEEQRAQVLALATDFPRLWQDPGTPDRERKRMARLILEDVTLLKREEITAHIRFRGGATRTLVLPIPLPSPYARRTAQVVVQEIDRLLDGYTDGQIAILLNQQGLRSGEGKPFHRLLVANIRRDYGLRDRFTRLRARGMLTQEEMAAQLGVCTATVKKWRRGGLLPAHHYDDKGGCLYEPPGERPPIKGKHKLGGKQTCRESKERGVV
ncbi:MAG: recombinase family protein [Chloroflexota bacterium]|nr:recombinase family protein [Chloroflexota bacterium]